MKSTHAMTRDEQRIEELLQVLRAARQRAEEAQAALEALRLGQPHTVDEETAAQQLMDEHRALLRAVAEAKAVFFGIIDEGAPAVVHVASVLVPGLAVHFAEVAAALEQRATLVAAPVGPLQ